jgi:hypothetical protein
MHGQRAFLEGLLDDAGLFPPESLIVEQMIERHRAAEGSPAAWMLGRVVVGSSKLPQYAGSNPGPWPVCVVIDSPLVHDGFAAARDAAAAGVNIVAIEIPIERGKGASSVSRLDDLCTQLTGAGLGAADLYIEIPVVHRDAMADQVAAIAHGAREHGLDVFAKIRCGGRALPAPEMLAGFLCTAARAQVAWKATAGLHQPLAHDGVNGFEHGFVNLVGGAILAYAGAIAEPELAALLSETAAAAISLGEAGFRWGSHAASPEDIAVARREFVHSFGTCSLDEPIAGLRALGVMEPAAV